MTNHDANHDAPRRTAAPAEMLAAALAAPEASARLRAAMSAGSAPDPAFLEPLVERCRVEPDFFVRDTLTWALAALPRELSVPRLLIELQADGAQARSQALHTLSKIGDPSTRHAILPSHLHDADPEVARTAWRAAAGLTPEPERAELAAELSRELGRGDLELMRSLSRALVELGDAAHGPVSGASLSDDEDVRRHAKATLRLLDDPEAGFYLDPKD